MVATVVASAFFFCFWGTNAEALGARDMGIALALSFAVPLSLYVSLAVAVADLALGVHARMRGRPSAGYFAAFAVAMLPALFLLIVDLV